MEQISVSQLFVLRGNAFRQNLRWSWIKDAEAMTRAWPDRQERWCSKPIQPRRRVRKDFDAIPQNLNSISWTSQTSQQYTTLQAFTDVLQEPFSSEDFIIFFNEDIYQINNVKSNVRFFFFGRPADINRILHLYSKHFFILVPSMHSHVNTT